MLVFYTNPILLAAAVIPALILLVKVYRSDKLDKEPLGLLISLVFYGVIATGLAIFTESLGHDLLLSLYAEDTLLYRVLFYFVVVALSEEGFKYLLLKRRTWHSPAFNCQFDGVVYAVFVSLGFALWENIGYVMMYGLPIALVRAVTAIPGHACFGVFMGTWYGIAKKYEQRGRMSRSRHCRKMALLIPVLLHGCYDFTATFESEQYGWIFFAFVAAMFLVVFMLVRKMSQQDQYISRESMRYWR